MERYNWAAIEEEKLNPLLGRKMIHTGIMTLAQIWLGKGCVIPEHHHVNQQTTMLRSGSLKLEIDGETVVLKAGDVMVIPPNVPHRFEALEESVATDLFVPQREDWIRGDDSYLRK
jgi:quercetin dioxygenase-like cupin family protein